MASLKMQLVDNVGVHSEALTAYVEGHWRSLPRDLHDIDGCICNLCAKCHVHAEKLVQLWSPKCSMQPSHTVSICFESSVHRWPSVPECDDLAIHRCPNQPMKRPWSGWYSSPLSSVKDCDAEGSKERHESFARLVLCALHCPVCEHVDNSE